MDFPAFLEKELLRQYGEEILERIRTGMNARRCVSLRVNTLKSGLQKVKDTLSQNGMTFEPVPFSEEALLLPEAREADLWHLPLYENGEIYLQSLSSMLPPLLLKPREKADILDMAAAPGGKTVQMAALSNNLANITACEINAIRAEKLKHNVQMQGATRVNVMVRDASKLEDFFRFDQILLDAPCSGSGTILLNEPATCRAFSEKLVRNSAAVQLKLLKKALTILKPGGTMVYSTCSILDIENEGVVRAALKGAKAELLPPDIPGLDSLPLLPTTLPGALCVCPTAQYEGFFVVRIQKH